MRDIAINEPLQGTLLMKSRATDFVVAIHSLFSKNLTRFSALCEFFEGLKEIDDQWSVRSDGLLEAINKSTKQ